MDALSASLLAMRFIGAAFMQVEQEAASSRTLQCSQGFQSSFLSQSLLNRFCFSPLLNDCRGKPYYGSIGWKDWPTEAGFVLSVVCFPCTGTEDVVSKNVEAAASVVAVLMLTSGISVVDADEYILWSTTFPEGSATWFQVGVALSFFLLKISSRFWECLVATRLRSLFPILKWKERMQKIKGWQVKIMNSCWNFSYRNKMLEIGYKSHLHGLYFFTITSRTSHHITSREMDKFSFKFKHISWFSWKKCCVENVYVNIAGAVEKGANSILLNWK